MNGDPKASPTPDDLSPREREAVSYLEMLDRQGANQRPRPAQSQYCEHGGYRSLCPECSELR